MYLNTLGKNELYESVAQITGVNIKSVKNFIKGHAEKIVECHYDEYSIEQMNLEEFLKGNRTEIIDSVIIHHISPRESENSIWQERLMTLPHALTRETVISTYLKKIGFTFSFDGNQIYMSKNGKYVDVKNKLGTNLKMRLGGSGTYNDFNINGYLFVDEFIEDAIRGWLGSPEFLKSLANYYERNDIADDFAENCYNYLVSFKVATDKIDINGWSEKISVMRKTEILLRYAVNALSYYEINRTPFLQMDNPIIYLKRDYDVPKENIKKIWGLKRKPGKWTPVEIV